MFVKKRYEKKHLSLGEQLLKNMEESALDRDSESLRKDLLKKIRDGKLF